MLRSPARIVLAAALALSPSLVLAKSPAEMVGTWTLSFDKTGSTCRVMLRAEKSDKGDYFLGMPAACRHAMPGIAAIGRWAMPDESHVVLGDPGGATLLTLAASGAGFADVKGGGTFALEPVAAASTAGAGDFTTVDENAHVAETPARFEKVASRRSHAEDAEPAEGRDDVAGRYAVMREKRDTGCMITLDKARASGGDRAQLAPGCRDQGIVIFDPSAWQLVRGALVLTARAGHKTRLERQAEGQWSKDLKEGGKPLGLKKL